MARRRRKSAFIGCLAAGAMIALSAREGFAWTVDLSSPVQGDRPQTPLTALDPTQASLNLFDQDRLSSSKFSTSLNYGVLNFGVDSNFRDATAISGNSFLGFIIGNNARWRENQVGYTNMNADLGGSFRVKTRFGASTYGASDQFFASLGKAPEEQRD